MITQLNSVIAAANNFAAAEQASRRLAEARQNYIDGMRARVSDAELRHLHLDAMAAAAASDKAWSTAQGIRKVEYII